MLGEREKEQSPGLSALARTSVLLLQPAKAEIQDVRAPVGVFGGGSLG